MASLSMRAGGGAAGCAGGEMCWINKHKRWFTVPPSNEDRNTSKQAIHPPLDTSILLGRSNKDYTFLFSWITLF